MGFVLVIALVAFLVWQLHEDVQDEKDFHRQHGRWGWQMSDDQLFEETYVDGEC